MKRYLYLPMGKYHKSIHLRSRMHRPGSKSLKTLNIENRYFVKEKDLLRFIVILFI
jgi:hypothetical protein